MRLVALLLVLTAACGGDGKRGQADLQGSARARGAVVAKVNNAAIGLEQVRELSASAGLSLRDALARLEDEQLLAEEAARRGYGRADGADEQMKRALVQALLARTVEQKRAEDFSPSEVRARFDDVAKQQKGLTPESFGKYEQEVRAQLLFEQRQAVFEKLIRELRARIGVKLSEPEVQKALSDPTFWGESS